MASMLWMASFSNSRISIVSNMQSTPSEIHGFPDLKLDELESFTDTVTTSTKEVTSLFQDIHRIMPTQAEPKLMEKFIGQVGGFRVAGARHSRIN